MHHDNLSIAWGGPLEDEPGMGPLTIPAYLHEVVCRHGPAEALVMWQDDRRIAWTYDELLARANEVAQALIAAGLGRDGRVGILMTNRPEFLAALFGTALAGGVPVALSTFSTSQELDHLLQASQVSILLFEEQVLKTDFRAMLAGLEPAVAAPGPFASARYPYLSRLVTLGGEAGGAVSAWGDFLAAGAGIGIDQVAARSAGIVPSDPGGIFFSSGTTSLPKGIVHAHRAFCVQWWRWPRIFCMNEPVRSWTCNGFFWSGNISMVGGAALSTGGAIVLQRWFDAEEALRLFERERVSFINGRPHQWVRLQGASNWVSADLSSIKYVPRGELIWQHPTVDTDWDVPMAFGTTETMTVCTGMQADATKDDYAGSFGRPFPGNTIRIIDPFTRAVLPLGQIGEFCVKGPTLMMGYLGKAPEDCFDAEGFYCTGDGGWIDETGRFFWDGRLTDMIKTGGANVAPMEVDEAIATIPGVKRSQTVGVPDDLLGEMVVACVVPADGASLSEAAIIAFVRERLASFKVPKRVLFFTDDDYALTGNEKIKTSVLRELAVKRLGDEA